MKIIKSTPIKIIIIVFIAVLITHNFNYSSSEIITYSFILNAVIGLFSVSLAIVAILFTILDRYKNFVADKKTYLQKTNSILKEMSDDSISLFFVICILFLSSLLNELISLFNCFDISTFILIFSLLLSLYVVYDISKSIMNLINALRQFEKADEEDFHITDSEKNLIEVYRKLDDKRGKELLETIKTLIIKQNLDK